MSQDKNNVAPEENSESYQAAAESWDAYLDYLRERANRDALRRASIAEGENTEKRRGSIDGSGTIQIDYVTLHENPPWSADDLKRFDALTDGGVWQGLDDETSDME
ncbi:MAG TPA: hypothetical protein VJZ27_10005 [Aggregatilineales bacterium]|nr:hypothetical protein [Aggregatilineales bacterium]